MQGIKIKKKKETGGSSAGGGEVDDVRGKGVWWGEKTDSKDGAAKNTFLYQVLLCNQNLNPVASVPYDGKNPSVARLCSPLALASVAHICRRNIPTDQPHQAWRFKNEHNAHSLALATDQRPFPSAAGPLHQILLETAQWINSLRALHQMPNQTCPLIP